MDQWNEDKDINLLFKVVCYRLCCKVKTLLWNTNILSCHGPCSLLGSITVYLIGLCEDRHFCNPQTFSEQVIHCFFFNDQLRGFRVFLIELRKLLVRKWALWIRCLLLLLFNMQMFESFKWSYLFIFSIKIANIPVCARHPGTAVFLSPFHALVYWILTATWGGYGYSAHLTIKAVVLSLIPT